MTDQPVDPRHKDTEPDLGPMANDEQLARDVKKLLPRGACKSILVGEFEGQRGAVKCVAKGKHSEHEAGSGDKWYLKEDGHWGMDVVVLSNVNTAYAGKRPIDA